jgi:hypothetical protein
MFGSAKYGDLSMKEIFKMSFSVGINLKTDIFLIKPFNKRTAKLLPNSLELIFEIY